MEECREVVDAAFDTRHHVVRHVRQLRRAEERPRRCCWKVGGTTSSIATKFRFGRADDGGLSSGVDWVREGRAGTSGVRSESSLTRLRTDWIDLAARCTGRIRARRSRRPCRRCSDLVHEGKVRYLENSNFAAWQITEADGRPGPRAAIGSLVPRASTTCSSATPSGTWFRPWCATVSVCFRSTHWPTGCLPGNTIGASRRRPAAESSPGGSKGCSPTRRSMCSSG